MDEINAQLTQMRTALELASEEDKPGIQMIIEQLEELLGGETGTTGQEENENSGGDQEEDEYKLFQADIAALASTEESTDASTTEATETAEEVNKSIVDELEALIGMKCKAPHQENWGQIGYYSAMISSVLSLEGGGDDNEDSEQPNDLSSILVRVIFMQPVVKSQLLCPFYKEDRCKFSDQDCKYSHGEVVPLAQLREYKETDYSAIVPGSRVLAKYHDELWYKATVQKITEDGECMVSYDVGNEALTVPLHETCLLEETSADDDISSSSSSEDDIENPHLSSSSDSEEDIPKSLLGGGNDGMLDMKGGSALGDWERHTKGIGSKLMMRMGYVMGTGLGRHREGRVDPVDAIVLPPGKSLDACMELKEKAKDGNLFSAEKRRLKAQRREAKQREKIAAQDKLKEEKATSMFNFLNEKLALRKNNTGNSSSSSQSNNLLDLRKQSCVNLNKRALGVHENLRQVTKDIQKTKESMQRHKGKDKGTYAIMEKKLADLECRKRELDRLESRVANEQKLRSDKRKLVLF